jgi:hypothetical protein
MAAYLWNAVSSWALELQILFAHMVRTVLVLVRPVRTI